MLELVTTADGSNTLYHPAVGEHYHSKHGAVQESKHVFLNSGLLYYLKNENQNCASVLEVGFGTGLNFLLSADFCAANHIKLNYTGIEAYPLSPSLIAGTGYHHFISDEIWNAFLQHYPTAIEGLPVAIYEAGMLEITHCKLLDFESPKRYDVIYFDAFAAIHQPEMWTEDSLAHTCSFLKPGGVFVTYAITGNLKRTMKALGFQIEKAPGAPGKREMLRAIKHS